MTPGQSPDVEQIVRAALAEDLGTGDLTSAATVAADRRASARLIAKADGVVAGVEVARAVFRAVDHATSVVPCVPDGTPVRRGDLVLEVSGAARSILSAERVALNFLGRLSGVATLTARYVAAVAGTGTRIIDTRKTTPGLRMLEKYAVRMGGGANHRIGLWDMVLVKENHIRAASGIARAATACRTYLAANGRTSARIEIETTTLAEVDEALAVAPDRIMLDNMDLATMSRAVARIRAENPWIEIEASGNMALDRVRAVAGTGVDLISVGALTHSAPALDLSLLFAT